MLLEQIDDDVLDTVSEQKIIERQKVGNAELANLLSLFSLGATFGRSDRIAVARSQREGLVQELRRVVMALMGLDLVGDLRRAVADSKFSGVYFYYEGRFTVASYNEQFAYLRSSLLSDLVLVLCNFSFCKQP